MELKLVCAKDFTLFGLLIRVLHFCQTFDWNLLLQWNFHCRMKNVVTQNFVIQNGCNSRPDRQKQREIFVID
jgi:hypothetical protein